MGRLFDLFIFSFESMFAFMRRLRVFWIISVTTAARRHHWVYLQVRSDIIWNIGKRCFCHSLSGSRQQRNWDSFQPRHIASSIPWHLLVCQCTCVVLSWRGEPLGASYRVIEHVFRDLSNCLRCAHPLYGKYLINDFRAVDRPLSSALCEQWRIWAPFLSSSRHERDYK